MRIHGTAPYRAFIRVFGSEWWENAQLGHQRIEAIEATRYYCQKYEERVKTISISELWSDKKAIIGLLTIAKDPMVKCATRLAAEKELSLLAGIVIIDENGKTKAGRTLDDFYKSVKPSPVAAEQEAQ